MKISEMDDETAAATLLKAYRGACDAFDPAEHGEHPSRDANRWIRIAASGGTNSEKQIEKPAAQDAALQIEEYRILNSGHHDVAGQLAVHRARQANPTRARRMADAIPGYNRIK